MKKATPRHCLIAGRIACRMAPAIAALLWSMPVHAGHAEHAGQADHAGHADHKSARTVEESPDNGVSRSLVSIRLPDVLIRQHNGQQVRFASEVDDSRALLLNFVYTSCTAICLPMAQIFSAAQERLGARADQLHMLSVSIDPAQDTPARLKEYAERFQAGPQWIFNTGSQQAVDSIQRAFNVYRSDKMGHTPVTFIKPRGSQEWVRLDGFASPDQLIREALGPVIARR